MGIMLNDNEFMSEYKMHTLEECLQVIARQHKEINRQKAEIERVKEPTCVLRLELCQLALCRLELCQLGLFGIPFMVWWFRCSH